MSDLNDLINAASGKTDAPKRSNKTFQTLEIEGFINHYSITDGSSPMCKRLVYDYYVRWSKNPMTFKGFVVGFNRKFKTRHYNGIKCYYLNPESLALPPFYSMGKDRRYFKVKSKRKYNFIGVTETFGYYIARLKTEENLHYLGRFKTAKEAAIAHDIEAYKHFGNDAKLNFPQDAKKYDKEKKE
jgi:hypothetical protein